MKYPKSCKIQTLLNEEGNQQYANNAMLDVDASVLIATDARAMVVLPVTLDDGDISGLVPRSAITAACKGGGRDARIGANGKAVVRDAEFERQDASRFPDWRQVIADSRYDRNNPGRRVAAFSIDTLRLGKLAAAMGTDCLRVEIVLEDGMAGLLVPPGNTFPARVSVAYPDLSPSPKATGAIVVQAMKEDRLVD